MSDFETTLGNEALAKKHLLMADQLKEKTK
jgi:hypothetical protein